MTSLSESGKNVDLLTLNDELRKDEDFDDFAVLALLDVDLPDASAVQQYIETLHQYRLRREMRNTAMWLASESIRQPRMPSDIWSELQCRVDNMGDRSAMGRGPRTLEDLLGQYGAEISERPPRRTVGLPTGFRELDSATLGLSPGQLIHIAGRPGMGKSLLAINICQNVAFREGKRALLFSLEMTAPEIIERIVACEGEVDHAKVRSGQMDEQERAQVRMTMRSIKSGGLMIDDSSTLSISDVVQRARKIHNHSGLDLIVVDYLGLMTVPRGYDRNDLAIGAISKSLKSLAKDLEIPVISVVQLSRACEHREDKHPILSDIRDCLSVSSTRLFAPGGALCNTSSRMLTYGLSKEGRIEMMQSSNVPKAKAKTFTVRLRSGRWLRCTAKHRFLTDRGYVAAKDLTPDHAIASVREIEEPAGTIRIDHARWMGWMLGNGSMTGYNSPSFSCSCEVLARKFVRETERLFGVTPKPHPHHRSKKIIQYDLTKSSVRTPEGNPVTNWLREHGMWGPKAPDKHVPEWFMEKADNQSMAELLGGMIDTDGSAYRVGRSEIVSFATTSEQMMWQYVFCMNRLGIFVRVDSGRMNETARHPCYKSIVQDSNELRKLRDRVRLTGRKADILASFELRGVRNNCSDRVGRWVSDWVRSKMDEHSISISDLGYRPQGKRMSQQRLRSVCGALARLGVDTSEIRHLASRWIYWDRLASIEPHGEEQVFDRTVPGANNFIANGILVHNSGSLEQDAHIILFVYRESQYDSTKAEDKAELMIAKNRGGPTGVVQLGFEGKYMRFTCRGMRYGDPTDLPV